MIINVFILKAMIDICAERGWLACVLQIQQIMQCTIQARWQDDCSVLQLPHVEEYNVPLFRKLMPELVDRYIFGVNFI